MELLLVQWQEFGAIVSSTELKPRASSNVYSFWGMFPTVNLKLEHYSVADMECIILMLIRLV